MQGESNRLWRLSRRRDLGDGYFFLNVKALGNCIVISYTFEDMWLCSRHEDLNNACKGFCSFLCKFFGKYLKYFVGPHHEYILDGCIEETANFKGLRLDILSIDIEANKVCLAQCWSISWS